MRLSPQYLRTEAAVIVQWSSNASSPCFLLCSTIFRLFPPLVERYGYSVLLLLPKSMTNTA